MENKITIHNCDTQEEVLAKNKKEIFYRKFVPISLTITRENQCIQTGVKLPFKTSRIRGVLTTSNLTPNVSIPSREQTYFSGITFFPMVDTSFLKLSSGNSYTTPYPPDLLISYPIQPDQEPYWYFACPATDILPFFFIDRGAKILDDYREVLVQLNEDAAPEVYYLWSASYFREGIITFEQFSNYNPLNTDVK